MYFPNFPILNSSETDLTGAESSSTEIAAIFVVDKTQLTKLVFLLIQASKYFLFGQKSVVVMCLAAEVSEFSL